MIRIRSSSDRVPLRGQGHDAIVSEVCYRSPRVRRGGLLAGLIKELHSNKGGRGSGFRSPRITVSSRSLNNPDILP